MKSRTSLRRSSLPTIEESDEWRGSLCSIPAHSATPAGEGVALTSRSWPLGGFRKANGVILAIPEMADYEVRVR